MKVSVIIPVYNAEKTLENSLRGLRMQSFRDFEVVFVNDCSSDSSLSVMQKFKIESGIPCKIVSQPQNGGVAAARNRGLGEAEGEYLAFVDADDSISNTALEVAVSNCGDADIVGWDWTLGFEKNGRYMRQGDYSSPLEALKNLMGGTMRWNLWLFMIKRSLVMVNGIRFISGANMGEDMQFMIKAFCKADKVVQIHESLYNYNAVSETSLSRQFSEKRRSEIETNVTEVSKVVEGSDYSSSLSGYIDYLKLYLKLPLLISSSKSDYEVWFHWFNESNGSAFSNKSLPLRTRCLQLAASHRLWAFVKTYYLMVYKFVYGVIYK